MKLPIPAEQLEKRLIQEGLVTHEAFLEIVGESGRKNQDVIDLLISRGMVEARYLHNILASLLGVPLASFETRQFDKELVKTLPEEVARKREVIIFSREEDGALNVAMADPSDLDTVKYLSQFFGAKINPFLATG